MDFTGEGVAMRGHSTLAPGFDKIGRSERESALGLCDDELGKRDVARDRR